MRAINCTQCGASIENVSERSFIVDCEYCGARMIMDRGEPVVKPTSVTPPDLELDAEAGPTFSFMAVAIAGVAVIPKSGKKDDLQKKEAFHLYKAVPASSPSSSWNVPATAEPAKSLPVVNYQPRVSWTGPNDMEYFDDPEVDVSSVSDLTSEEVEKTVFKNRVVKLKVV